MIIITVDNGVKQMIKNKIPMLQGKMYDNSNRSSYAMSCAERQ